MKKLRLIPKPAQGEYPEYSEMYMELVPDDGRVLEYLRDNFTELRAFLSRLPEEQLFYRYAEGKWSIKEILVHLVDDERIFAYRALCYARNDHTELPGFEQDEYVRYSGADERSLDSIFREYEAVRNATISMFDSFPEEALTRSGAQTGNVNRRTVRAMAYHIAGHELRHFQIIKERYLGLT
ncbi:MAG TPA: DinB family protein [Puia sp.]|nr:DinB family protein [Puia sp.]